MCRINVYSQELTKEISVVKKTTDTGITYFGVRMFLALPDILHHTPEDDDRSAITFWIPHAEKFTQEDLADVFERMANAVRACPPKSLKGIPRVPGPPIDTGVYLDENSCTPIAPEPFACPDDDLPW